MLISKDNIENFEVIFFFEIQLKGPRDQLREISMRVVGGFDAGFKDKVIEKSICRLEPVRLK